MIVVVEPTYGQHDHAAVNAALLDAIALAFPGEPILFASSPVQRSHVERIHAVPPQMDVADIAVGAPGGVKPGRMLSQWRALRAVVGAHGPRIVILLSAGPETLFAARALAIEFPAVRLFIVLHGNLADAAGQRSRDPRRRLIDMRAGLSAVRHPRIRLVVLAEHVRTAIVADGLAPAEDIVVWPHPVASEEIDPHPAAEPHAPIRIAFLGSALRRKGFDKFVALVRAVAAVRGDVYRFSLIGTPLEHFPEARGVVEMPGLPLERAEYLRRLRAVDYVALLFDEAADRFTASGSLLDCAAQARPVVTLDLAAVRNLADGHGPIGFTCGSVEEMASLLLDRPEALADGERYGRHRSALMRAAASRLPGPTAALIRRDAA